MSKWLWYVLGIVCDTAAFSLTHIFTWQNILSAFLYMLAGVLIYVSVYESRWSRARVSRKSLRALSSELYNMTPEQQYRAQQIDEAAKRHDSVLDGRDWHGND